MHYRRIYYEIDNQMEDAFFVHEYHSFRKAGEDASQCSISIISYRNSSEDEEADEEVEDDDNGVAKHCRLNASWLDGFRQLLYIISGTGERVREIAN